MLGALNTYLQQHRAINILIRAILVRFSEILGGFGPCPRQDKWTRFPRVNVCYVSVWIYNTFCLDSLCFENKLLQVEILVIKADELYWLRIILKQLDKATVVT